jgi:putative hydrolase of the HAD superfamily
MQELTGIQVIAFDADDTLWVNETWFREAEEHFCELLADYMPADEAFRIVHETEMQNLPLYGYGIKPFTLSLIEAAIRVSGGQLPTKIVNQLIEAGKQMLQKPVCLLPGIEETLTALAGDYRLVMATKGDLLDQERKLLKSGLERYFHHIEIVADKTPLQYRKLVRHLDVTPQQFLMIGNSPRSDILPVLEIGAWAFHVPFHTTWIHEIADQEISHPRFRRFTNVREIPEFLQATG